MKKIYFFYLLFTLLLSQTLQAQIVNIPDYNFKFFLLYPLSTGGVIKDLDGNTIYTVDTNNDGKIQESEVSQIKELYFSLPPVKSIHDYVVINSLEGIKSFTHLEVLSIPFSTISSLDLGGLTNLKKIIFNQGNISSLNLQGLTNLEYLDCRLNYNLQSIDLQGLSKFKYINIAGCNLTEPLQFLQPVKNTLQSLSFDVKSNDDVNYLQNFDNLTYLAFHSGISSVSLPLIKNLTDLKCSGFHSLYNLDINNLIKLKNLTCEFTEITSLNLLGLQNLENIKLNNNKLSSIEYHGSSLINLDCSSNNITDLNIQNCLNLKSLNCSENKISNVNLQGFNNLEDISFYKNNLTSINLNGLINLISLDLSNNLFTSINLDEQKNLKILNCSNNLITFLDLEKNYNLEGLDANTNPNLRQLKIKNGTNELISISNCPLLNYICCDENEINFVTYVASTSNSQAQAAINTYCTFVPGGNYNTISGIARIDFNNNGCDSNDLPFFPIKYSITDGTNSGTIFGNENGEYKNYLSEGNYSITPILENPDYFIVSPTSKDFIFTDNNNNLQTQDFCITSNGTKNDLDVKIIPITNARPGFNSQYEIFYKNKGNTILNGSVDFYFDHTKTEYISSDILPDTQSSEKLSWNFNNLKPFENHKIKITLKTKTPPIVNTGDILVFTSNINPILGDQSSSDNTFNLNQTVVGSLDPNDKICLEGNIISPQLIGNFVTYKIHFENTGTANAEQIVVKDLIDTSTFDISSIIPISASHNFKTRISGNILEFIFENIDLPFDDENNDGYIVFKIKTLPSLAIGSILNNKADIFFDYNLPVTTNIASSQFLNSNNIDFKSKFKIFPNPVKDKIFIETSDKLKNIEVFDETGRIIQSIINPEKIINFSSYKKGIYFIKINTSNNQYVQKIIKE